MTVSGLAGQNPGVFDSRPRSLEDTDGWSSAIVRLIKSNNSLRLVAVAAHRETEAASPKVAQIFRNPVMPRWEWLVHKTPA